MKIVRLARGFLISALLATVTTITGCNSLGTDNIPKPPKLQAIHPEFWPVHIWAQSVGQGADSDYLLLGPILSNNTVYLANKDGKLVAVNATNGRILWTVKTKAVLTSPPALAENLLVIGAADGQLFAFDPASGKLIWHIMLTNQILASPQIGQGRVLIKTIDGKLIALAAQDGRVLWTYNHGSPTLILRGGSRPLIIGNTVVSGFADGKLAAFNLNDGHLLWEQEVAEPQGISQVEQMVDIVADPQLNDDVVYVATYQGKLSAITLQGGKTLWQQKISSYTGLALNSQQVFITDAMSNVFSFDRTTGNQLWQQIGLRNRRLGAPVLMNNMLVIADGEGAIHWLSIKDGHVMARAFANSKKAIIAAPVVNDTNVIAVTVNGVLNAWQIRPEKLQPPSVFSFLVR